MGRRYNSDCFLRAKNVEITDEMSKATPQETEPPKLRRTAEGRIEMNSLADTVEWFLNFDERTARMRHPMTEELFQWKQQTDAAHGIEIYPFENAEARFAIGVIQALGENDSEPKLRQWITDVLTALGEAKQTREDLAEMFNLNENAEQFALEKAAKLTTNAEKRIYLTSCWLEALCTAEARVLGWIYQELYDVPFQPNVAE
jgi:hypothetical protein